MPSNAPRERCYPQTQPSANHFGKFGGHNIVPIASTGIASVNVLGHFGNMTSHSFRDQIEADIHFGYNLAYCS